MIIELTPELHQHAVNLMDAGIRHLGLRAMSAETLAVMEAMSAPLKEEQAKSGD